MIHPNKEIMEKVIALAKEKKAVASIIVKNGEIIAQGVTTVFVEKQPFRHAEINVIESACKKLGSFDLSGCWLYTTYEPCPMCASACIWAKFEGVVYGANIEDRNDNYTQRILIRCRDVFKNGTPKIELYEDFMRDECLPLLLL